LEPDLIAGISEQRFLGIPVESHPSLGSTNDEAFRRAREGAPEGLVVVAGHQTAGKGRLGRSWFDEAGRSLMFSILLKPTLPLRSFPLLALALASAVADAGSEIAGEPLTIKWPNDVLHRGRKLCGVLAESRALRAGEAPALVLGAGVNVNLLEWDFPPELRPSATSLRIAAGSGEIPLAPLLASILARFHRDLALTRGGDPGALYASVRPRLPERGARVRIALPERAVEGELLDVTDGGALRVREAASGRIEILAAGVME
jgi:BirA family transcriptional regulator, biotin operon repressor / biotin---[acetyl-CoA-carboxylase] ligase